MPTYFDLLRQGMRQAQAILQELLPGAESEWGPMDNHGFYPLWLVQGRSKTIIHRFSKDALAALAQEPPQPGVVEQFRQSVYPYVPR